MERTFAKIENNEVVQVIVAESKEWCEENLGGEWVEYGGDSGRRQTGIGHLYHKEKENFYSKQPFDSWLFDKDNLAWVAPKQKPAHKEYSITKWDEQTNEWVQIKS